MGITTDSTPERNATQEELHQYKTAREQFEKLDTSGTYDASDPDQRLFFISFDGTCNDRDSSDSGGDGCLVVKAYNEKVLTSY